MSWSCALFDTVTGLVGEPIDIPNLSWTLTVSDCSLTTTKDKGTGEGEATGLTLPWGAVPGSDRYGKLRAIDSMRRGVVLMWDGVPVVAGAIGDRTDGAEDTTFSLVSPMSILSSRYVVEEETFGAKKGKTDPAGEDEKPKAATFTTSKVSYRNLSLRAIACDLVRRCTEEKPGGELPIDLPYVGEKGRHERTYEGWNVANNACSKRLDEIASVQGGPDIQLRPYLDDASHLRWALEAGSDAEPFLQGGSPTPFISYFRGGTGGSMQEIKVAWSGPAMRVYGTGSGQDEGTICHLSEDLALCERSDPYPLIEATVSDTDWDSGALVRQHTDEELALMCRTVCQIQGEVHAADPSNPVKPGLVWPGQLVEISIEDFPSLPDGIYSLRLMEMSGDLTDTVTLTFDPIDNPWEV